jgi:predicted nucleic-acid-binding protein
MRAVDTNVLVRILTRDNAEQATVADAFIARGAWVSQIVLVEAAWVLRSGYRLGHAEVAKTIEMLLKHESLTLQDPDVVSAALVHYQRRPSLGFSDCLILEIAKKAGHLPLGTFDRDLSKFDGAERL